MEEIKMLNANEELTEGMLTEDILTDGTTISTNQENYDAIKFALDYKKVNNKTAFLKDRLIIKDYVPYLDKVNICRAIVGTTTYVQDEEGNIVGYRVDTPVRNILYKINMINLYTNLTINFDEVATTYDTLKTSGLMDYIFTNGINRHELTEMEEIKKLVEADFEVNTLSARAFVDSMVNKASSNLGVYAGDGIVKLAEAIEKTGAMLQNEETLAKLSNIFNLVKKFSDLINKEK